jgi:hypothetical protein
VTTCPSCGLELPGYARFCARCGSRLSGRGQTSSPVAIWVILVFAAGAALASLIAAAYSALFAFPELAATGTSSPPPQMAPSQLRLTMAVISVVAWIMVGLQVAAIVGMVRGRFWGRVLATIACFGWMLTCIGVPFAFLMAFNVWRQPAVATKLGQ